MITAIEKGGDGEQKCTSVAGHFEGHADAHKSIWSSSPNLVCSGLLQKPLDTAIGRLIPPYHPGGCQGDNQQNNDATCTQFAGRFDGPNGGPVLCCMHHRMEEVHGFHKSPKRQHRASTHSNSINRTSDMPTPDVGGTFYFQSFKRARVALMTIGV